MKKIISLMLSLVLAICALSGCAQRNSDNSGKPKIVTTVFPIYDWVKNITGESDAEITMLLDSGVDLHSYQPTADDLIAISMCDLFIYIGGESDEWVEDALKTSKNDNRRVINLLDVLGDKALTEDVEIGEEHEDEEEQEFDEHVWLSLKNAKIFTAEISSVLGEIDAAKASAYKANAESYADKLSVLDSEYENAVSGAGVKTLLFADRFPFKYLTEDYGLSYFAAFSGCSAESEADFETISFLANKVDELGLGSVLTLEGTKLKIAETVVSTAKSENIRILAMDSMQSSTLTDSDAGDSYLSIMEKNLSVLKEALK